MLTFERLHQAFDLCLSGKESQLVLIKRNLGVYNLDVLKIGKRPPLEFQGYDPLLEAVVYAVYQLGNLSGIIIDKRRETVQGYHSSLSHGVRNALIGFRNGRKHFTTVDLYKAGEQFVLVINDPRGHCSETIICMTVVSFDNINRTMDFSIEKHVLVELNKCKKEHEKGMAGLIITDPKHPFGIVTVEYDRANDHQVKHTYTLAGQLEIQRQELSQRSKKVA